MLISAIMAQAAVELQFIIPAAAPSFCSSAAHGQLKLFGTSQTRLSRLRVGRGARLEKLHRKAADGTVTTHCSSSSGEAIPLPNSGVEPKKGSAWSETLGRLYGSQAPPSLSDIFWPALGGFVAMAAMGYVDALLSPKGLNVTLGSFGAVCALLFAAPNSPVSQVGVWAVGHAAAAAQLK